MSTTKLKSATEEIRRLTAVYGGILTAEQLVHEARSRTSPLHKYFTWNDTEAAEKCRILEARHLLRACVTIIPNDRKKPIMTRATVHLSTDKSGYRLTAQVLTDAELCRIMMSDARNELISFKRKYARLSSLISTTALFRAIDRFVVQVDKAHEKHTEQK